MELVSMNLVNTPPLQKLPVLDAVSHTTFLLCVIKHSLQSNVRKFLGDEKTRSFLNGNYFTSLTYR